MSSLPTATCPRGHQYTGTGLTFDGRVAGDCDQCDGLVWRAMTWHCLACGTEWRGRLATDADGTVRYTVPATMFCHGERIAEDGRIECPECEGPAVDARTFERLEVA